MARRIDPEDIDSPAANAPAKQGYVAPTSAEEDPDAEVSNSELAVVKRLADEYNEAREFDKNARKQFAVDRRYAAGTSDLTWAVTTNLIGSFIDILGSMLYARDPDVSVRKAPQVDDSAQGDEQLDDFARTMELVISKLWKKGRLKKKGRKTVRSVLSIGQGWIKALMLTEKVPQPQVEAKLNDAMSRRQQLDAIEKLEEDPDEGMDLDKIDELKADQDNLIETLKGDLEKKVRKDFVIDFVPGEDIQISLDVRCIEDYQEADWIANAIYITPKDALGRFKRLKPSDLKPAEKYYQKEPRELGTKEFADVSPQGQITAEAAEAFTQNTSGRATKELVKVVELWDRRDGHIKTFICGVKKWAIEPFEPEYATERFYPYFYTAFYEVDGQRHPQSLCWRLYKLQDEYSCTRSNQRLTRERGIPGTLFDATQISDEEADKIKNSKQQEFTPVRPTNPGQPLQNSFIAKPVVIPPAALFDTTPITNDMEKISGVQEAQQAGMTRPKTATEASIQQSGFAARTTSDRDELETMLTELAQYTAELSIQTLEVADVQRMVGPAAYWPKDMSIEDILTMVELSIVAGSTGKPKAQQDQQTWGVVLPLLKETMIQAEQALANNNQPLYKVLCELVKETMRRMGDDMDVDKFIPQAPPPPTPPPPPPPPHIQLTGTLPPAESAELAGAGRPGMQPPPPGAPPGGPPGPPGAPGAPPLPIPPPQAAPPGP